MLILELHFIESSQIDVRMHRNFNWPDGTLGSSCVCLCFYLTLQRMKKKLDFENKKLTTIEQKQTQKCVYHFKLNRNHQPFI